VRQIRYQEIADELRERARRSPAGSVLPSESEMSTEFGASRVTIRRALELVREDGLIAARQGFGWFVATEPVPQSLESLATIESHVEGVGKLSERKIEEFAYEKAPKRVERVLGVDQVLRVKRVNLADGEPFAVVTVWCPAELGAHLSRKDVERRPFYELLDVVLRGATQTIGADLVDVADAQLLGQRAPLPGTPHRVRRRPAAGRTLDDPQRPAHRRVKRDNTDNTGQTRVVRIVDWPG